MKSTIVVIEDAVRRLDLEASLLVLNHILAVSREMTEDKELQGLIDDLPHGVPAHIAHFLAKQLLLHASNGKRVGLNWPVFRQLMDMVIALDDPIQHDSAWKHADPSGFFERVMAQQLPSQNRNLIQKYGLALGLFRDVGPTQLPHPYDLPREIETALGVTVEQFMAIGQVCLSLRLVSIAGGRTCMGTFTHEFLRKAYVQGIQVCVPEVWEPFLRRIACTPEQFQSLCRQHEYKSPDSTYVQFEFNPLRRFPIIEVTPDHFIAVDPELIVERTTFGLFYDLFERDRTAFSNNFGAPFEKFVGMLLGSALPAVSLWSHSQWAQANPKENKRMKGRVCDWAYVGESQTILFECKSLRPSLKLICTGSDESIQELTNRIVSGLEQLIGHNKQIEQGKWETHGLPRRTSAVFVLVMYGQVYTINAHFVRKRINDQLMHLGLTARPFVVLSLTDLDSVVRLVELGYPLDEIIVRLSGPEAHLSEYAELKEHSVSAFTFQKGKDFLHRITPTQA